MKFDVTSNLVNTPSCVCVEFRPERASTTLRTRLALLPRHRSLSDSMMPLEAFFQLPEFSDDRKGVPMRMEEYDGSVMNMAMHDEMVGSDTIC